MNIIKLINKFRFGIYILFSYLAYILIYLEFFQTGQLLQDDWSIAENSYYSKTILSRFDTYFNGFITRPIGALWLSLISVFEYDFKKYFFINITIYYIFNILIFKIFANKYNISVASIIFILLLFPNLNSTNIFSPAAQSLGVISLFFWSISFYLIYFGTKENNNIKIYISWVFFIISVLTYEISFILIIFNFFFNNQNLSKLINFLFHFKIRNILKFKEIKIFFLIFFLIVFYQLIITKFLSFEVSNRFRIFNNDNLKYLVEYYHIPFTIIYYSLIIFKDSFFNITIEFKNLIIILFLTIFFFKIIKPNQLNKLKDKNIFLILFISYLMFLFFFVIASSVPTIYGYYNRSMGAYNFLASIMLTFLLIDLPIKIFLKKILITLLILLNINNFLNQIDSNITASNLRNHLIDKILSKVNLNNKSQIYIFSLFPTYSKHLNLEQLIFSEESYDFNKAILYKSNRMIGGFRVYKSIECDEKYSLIEKNGLIIFYNPSKSKKNKNLEKITIKKEPNHIYLFYNLDEDRLYDFSSIDKLKKLENAINCN